MHAWRTLQERFLKLIAKSDQREIHSAYVPNYFLSCYLLHFLVIVPTDLPPAASTLTIKKKKTNDKNPSGASNCEISTLLSRMLIRYPVQAQDGN